MSSIEKMSEIIKQNLTDFTLRVKYFDLEDDWSKTFAHLTVILKHRSSIYRRPAKELLHFLRIRSEIGQAMQTTGERTVKLDDRLEHSAVKLLLEFPQIKQLRIHCGNVYGLLKTAECLQHMQMTNSCLEFFRRTQTVENVAEIHNIAHTCEIRCLIEATGSYIRKGFQEYSHSEGFLNLPLSCVREIIAEDDTKGLSEDVVFQAALRWGKNTGSYQLDMWEELLSEVRTKYVSDDCLRNALSENYIAESVIKDVITECIITQSSVDGNRYTEPRKNSQHDVCVICLDVLNFYVYVCDVDKGYWNFLAMTDIPPPFQHAAVVNERIYLVCSRTIEMYSLPTCKRETFITKGYVEGEAVVFHENKFYFFGYLTRKSKGRVCWFNIVNLRLYEKDMTLCLRYSAAVASGQNIYVTGGTEKDYVPNDAVHLYVPSANAWNYNFSKMLTKRAYHSGISVNDMIYVCGGRNWGHHHLHSAEVFDTRTRQWTLINDMAIGREKPSLVFCNRKVFAFGGVERTVAEDVFETYDPETQKWKCGFCTPEGLQCAVLVSTVYT